LPDPAGAADAAGAAPPPLPPPEVPQDNTNAIPIIRITSTNSVLFIKPSIISIKIRLEFK
jgi:hypothetical protein